MLLTENGAPAKEHPTRATIVASTQAFSIEALPRDAHRIRDFRDHLPTETPVYVGWPPKAEPGDLVDAARKLRNEGMIPIPHIPARRVQSGETLRDFVRALAEEANAKEVLLLGGDPDPPVGPYADASALLDSGVLHDFGIKSIGIAAHPEGHPSVSNATLHQVLQEKIRAARNAGLRVHIVSQFVLDPLAFIDWHAHVYGKLSPGADLRVGVPGVVSAKRLLQLASSCGVSGTLGMLRKNGRKLTQTAMNNGATEALVASLSPLVNRADPLSGFHFYPFGSFEKTAAWACAVAAGRFDTDSGAIRVH